MKQIKLLVLLMAMALTASAQYYPTLPSGFLPYSTQIYRKIVGTDTTFVTGATGKGFVPITAANSGDFLRLSGGNMKGDIIYNYDGSILDKNPAAGRGVFFNKNTDYGGMYFESTGSTDGSSNLIFENGNDITAPGGSTEGFIFRKWDFGNNTTSDIFKLNSSGFTSIVPGRVKGALMINSDGTATTNQLNFMIKSAADQINPATTALYVAPETSSQPRFFFGTSTNKLFSVDMSNVLNFSNVPAFSTNDNMFFGAVTGASHNIGRVGTDVIYGASANSGTADHIFYGKNTGFSGYVANTERMRIRASDGAIVIPGQTAIATAPTANGQTVRFQDVKTLNGTSLVGSGNLNVGTVTNFSVSTTAGNGVNMVVNNPTTTPSLVYAVDTTVLRTVSNTFNKAESNTRFAKLASPNVFTGGNQSITSGNLSVNGSVFAPNSVNTNYPFWNLQQGVIGSSDYGGNLSLSGRQGASGAFHTNTLSYNPATTVNNNVVFMPLGSGTLLLNGQTGTYFSTSLGVNTSTPTEVLDVSGAMRVNGTITTNVPNTSAFGYQSNSALWASFGANNSTIGTFTLLGVTANGSANLPILNTTASGFVGIRNSAPSEVLTVTGNILASGNITANSDSTLKKNIVPIENASSKLGKLHGYSFNWKDGGRKDIGVIAQEIRKVFPELVKSGNDGILSVNYQALVAPLIQANNEQEKRIANLEKKLYEILNRGYLTNSKHHIKKSNRSAASRRR